MTEETKVTTTPQEPTQEPIDYVDLLQKSEEARKKMEQDLAKSRSNERKWMDSALNSNPQNKQSDDDKRPSMDELMKIVFNTDGIYNDLDYTKAVLELRERKLKEEGTDVFVGYKSPQYEPGVDEKRGERIAAVLKECVDAANGNPSVFKAMFTSRLNK